MKKKKSKPLRIIIDADKDFNDYKLLCSYLDVLIQSIALELIISDSDYPIDDLVLKYAKEHKQSFKIFKIKWDEFGKRAPFMRNYAMCKYAEKAIIFWSSRYNCPIEDTMIQFNKQCYMVNYNE